MIRHVWSVLCQNASFDMQTKSVSLLNVLETAIALREPSAEKPAVISAELVSLWLREPDETPISGQARVFSISPGLEKSEPIVLEIPANPAPFHHTRLTITSFPISQKGMYQFHVEFRLQGNVKWKAVAAIPYLMRSQPKQ